jgi:hypothetical protein
MKVIRNTAFLTIFFSLCFLVVTLFLPGENAEPLYAGAATGVFGIFIGFSISGANGRLAKVNELLKADNAYHLICYNMAYKFGANTQSEVRKLIDAHLVAQIDYKIEDFDHSDPEFNKLRDYLLGLEFKSIEEEKAYVEIMQTLNKQTLNRSQVETAVSERISKYEWASIIFLLVLVVVAAHSMSDGTIMRAIFVSILATASVLLVLVLRDMNNLKWDKYTWTWKPLRKLFKDLGLVPYYGALAHEVKLEPNEEFRIVTSYPHEYPDVSDKKVVLVRFDAKHGRIVEIEQ